MSGSWDRFRARRRNLAGLALVLSLAAIALSADLLAADQPILRAGSFELWPPCRHGPYTIPPLGAQRFPAPPGPDHLLGTDNTGRDVLARLVHGTRVSLGIGVAAAAMQVLIGLLLGVLAGYFRGAVDAAITRVTEVVLSFPLVLLLLAVQGLLERTTLLSTLAVIGLTRWADTSRLVRAEALRVRELPYVEASRALGNPPLRTLVRHVLPNCLAPALVAATFGVGSAILLESALSFLGFGAPEPTASWGLLMADGFQDALDPAASLLVLLPGLAIFVTVSAFNLVGEGLRGALDPRAQGAVEPSAFITSDQKRAWSPAPMPDGCDPAPATYSVPEVK